MKPNCPWWVRWYHRRLRRIDRQTVGQWMTKHANPVARDLAWKAFIEDRGQAHWHCACCDSWTIK